MSPGPLMPLPFRPPLNEHEQRIFASLPKLNGYVVHPEWWPTNERQRGIREFLAWCAAHDRCDWPQWLNDWEIHYRLAQQSGRHVAPKGDHAAAVAGDAERRVDP